MAGLSKRTEVWKSLGTKDPKEARRRGPALVSRLQVEFEGELQALQRGGDSPSKLTPPSRKLHKPTQTEIEAVAWDMLNADLRADERERFSEPNAERRAELTARIREKYAAVAATIPEPKRAALVAIVESLDELTELDRPKIRKEMRGLEREGIAKVGAQDAFEHLAEAVISDRGWDVLPGSPEFVRLCHVLRSSRLHSLKAMAARDDGDFLSAASKPEPPASVVAANVVAIRNKAQLGESLLELLPQYLKEACEGLSKEERNKKEKVTELFAEHVGKTRAIGAITPDDFVTFKLALEHWPRVARNQSAFKGKDFNTIVEKNRTLKRPVIGRATINNYLSTLSAYFNWLFNHRKTKEARITQGLLLKHGKKRASRKPYTAEELKVIFSLPAFSGCESAENLARPGKVRIDDWRFWVPVCCLYTGARAGEIAQLRTQDVRKVGGHWALHITDEGDGMEVKTSGSRRIVPIHPELIRLGFLDYRTRIAKSHERLFHELPEDNRGRYVGKVTEWLRGYTARFQIKGANLYRLRHTFTDALRQAGYVNSEIGPLLVHSDGSTTESYGNLPQVTIDRRAELIAAATFPLRLISRQ